MAAAIIQRPLRGSRVSTFYPVKTLPPLSCLDSAFQLQEYISLLIRHDVHDVERIVALPGRLSGKDRDRENIEGTEEGKNEDKDDRAKNDVTVDEACWIYEQLRRLAQDLTHPLITMLQQECSRLTCPEMKAGEWLYLCVAHGTDGTMEQCCAIDYILHTLDSATALLNSPRAFPSRLQIPPASHRHFSSLARRLGRIFAHAYFHHRDIFAQAEAESSLYARFLALTTRYDLVPPDFIVIPPTKVVTTGEEIDIPRNANDKQGEPKTSIMVPDPSEVQPPRLLAASLDPQAEREKDKASSSTQRPQPISGPSTSSFNHASIRMLSNRNTSNTAIKTRNPPGLFVSGSGLIPLSSAATAAPTTAASLFASSEGPISTAAASASASGPSTGTSTTPSPEQGSPRKAGRPRTDTMVYSEGYSSDSGNNGSRNGRGTSPIPVVRLGARFNDPEEPPAPGSIEEMKKEKVADEETKATVEEEERKAEPVSVSGEAEPLVEETQEPVEGERKFEEADFVPIDGKVEVLGAPTRENYGVDAQLPEAEVPLTVSRTEVDPTEHPQPEEIASAEQMKNAPEQEAIALEPQHQGDSESVEETKMKASEEQGDPSDPAPAPAPAPPAESSGDSQLSNEVAEEQEQESEDDPAESTVTERDVSEHSHPHSSLEEKETNNLEKTEAKSEVEEETVVVES